MTKHNHPGKNEPGTPKPTPGPAAEPGENSDGGYNAGMAVFSYIIGGIIVWSLIGWGLDYLWEPAGLCS